MKWILTYTRTKIIEIEADGILQAQFKADENKPKGYELSYIEKENDIKRSRALRLNHIRDEKAKNIR